MSNDYTLIYTEGLSTERSTFNFNNAALFWAAGWVGGIDEGIFLLDHVFCVLCPGLWQVRWWKQIQPCPLLYVQKNKSLCCIHKVKKNHYRRYSANIAQQLIIQWQVSWQNYKSLVFKMQLLVSFSNSLDNCLRFQDFAGAFTTCYWVTKLFRYLISLSYCSSKTGSPNAVSQLAFNSIVILLVWNLLLLTIRLRLQS